MAIDTFRVYLLTGALAISASVALFTGSCSKYEGALSDASGSPQMSLDSGVDKKIVRSDASEAYGGYGGGYAGEVSSASAAPAVAATPGGPAGGGSADNAPRVDKLSVRARAQGSNEARLGSWIIPDAYAQDHNINERYLIRNGSCNIEVPDYREAAKQVNAIAEKYGGLVSGIESSRSGADWIQGTLTLRVPNKSFFNAWSEILMLGTVIKEAVGTEDASQQYISTLSRMQNLLAEEAAIKEMYHEALMIQRTRGVNEGYQLLINTQERLFQVSGEIQETEIGLNALADRITRSTISVSLSEKREIAKQAQETFSWGIGTTAAQAYRDLLLFLRAKLNALTYFLITCWTWLIPLCAFGYFAYWLYRRLFAGKKFHLAWAGIPGGPASAPAPAPPAAPAAQWPVPDSARTMADAVRDADTEQASEAEPKDKL